MTTVRGARHDRRECLSLGLHFKLFLSLKHDYYARCGDHDMSCSTCSVTYLDVSGFLLWFLRRATHGPTQCRVLCYACYRLGLPCDALDMAATIIHIKTVVVRSVLV